uniref:Ig-like domain-containing protein n=1 Tax=Monodelphis domestica TaxID=13616 RepID=M9MMJ0_MONDO
MMQGLLAAQTQKQNINRQQNPCPSRSGSQSRSWSCSHSASPSPSPPRTGNRTAHCSNHHSSSYAQPHTHSHHLHNTNHHPSNTCPTRRKATGLAKRKAKKGRSPYGREKRADRRAPVLKRKIPVLWSRGSSLHRDRDRLWGSHTVVSLESSRDSSRETPKDETPCWVGEQRFLGRREAVTPDEQCRPMERPSKASQSRGSTWKGLLIITATILSCWIQPTSAQDITVEVEPPLGTQGLSVTFRIVGYSGTPVMYNWYYKTSAQQPSRKHIVTYSTYNRRQLQTKIRQRVYHNGTMFFPNLLVNDSGYYEVQIIKDRWTLDRPEAGAPLTVYVGLSKPNIVTSNNTAVENNDFTLTCNATGYLPSTTWYINQRVQHGTGRIRLSPDNKTLTLPKITRSENKGPYMCEMVNIVSHVYSDGFILDVAYGPDSMTILPAADRYNVGEHIQLTCSAQSCNPPAQLTWLQNGQPVSNSGTFSATAALNHAGNYTCVAYNSLTGIRHSQSMNIIIYGPLSKPIILTSNNTAVETKDFSMTCQPSGAIVTTRWFINGLPAGGNRIQLSPDKSILTIRNLRRTENKGPYECETENTVSVNKSDPFTLDVTYGPDNATIAHLSNVYPTGANIIFNCSADSNPPAQLIWLRNGQQIRNSPIFSIIASVGDAGTYTCTASNSLTGLTRTASKTLRIYAPLSKPTILISNKTAVETKDFSMTCQATGQIEAYQWFINGLAPVGSRIQLSRDNRILTLPRLTRRDNQGPYVCGIENALFSSMSDPFILDVTYGPDTATIVRTPDVYPTGANIIFNCSADSNPPAQLIWLRNGQQIRNSSIFSIIASVGDAGTYTCSASNSLTGLTRTSNKTIRIYAPLSKPTILISNKTAVETKDFSMTCQATGQIEAYQWFINGLAPVGSRIQLSRDNRILTLPRLTRRDNQGPYVCGIENALFSSMSDPFILDVTYGPDIATIVHTPDVYPTGANIIFNCSADSNPPAQFIWLQNGQRVSSSATFSIIASLSDAGTYTCTASNSLTGLTRTATKNITIYAPLSKPTIVTSNITAVETKDFSFTCQATGQIHTYQWFINGLVAAGSRIQLSPDKRTLTLPRLTRRDNKGPYVCEIENPLFRNRSDPFPLNVTYGPDIATIVRTPDVYPTGANITFSCFVDSNPPAQFTWLQNGQRISNSATFSIIASLSDAGTYTCTASNLFTGLTRTATKNITIYAPLSKPTIITSNNTAVETKDFSMTCNATGQIHAYRWFINGLAPVGSRIQLSPDKRILTLRRLTRRENKGPYVCEIENPLFRNRSDPFPLNVTYGPDIATIVRSPDVYPTGVNITLSCVADSNPPAQFTWLQNGQSVSNSAIFSVISSLNHAGTYTCTASNSFTGMTRTATKNIIIYAPLSKPTIITSNNTAVETKDFSMTCNATGQIHAYRWFINGLALGGNRIQLSPDKRTLTIRSLRRTENKEPYVCEIENPLFSKRSNPFTLNVTYGPDNATIVHSANEYPTGANITLSCVADSNPAAQFTWLHNGQPVSNSATFSVIASLNHAGTYTCTASNSFTGLTRTATKNIIIYAPLSKPTIVTSNITAVETKDFSLTCQATGQIHAYQWFINRVAPAGSRIQLSPDKRTLTLSRLTRRDNKGPYECEILNPFYSNRSHPFTLDVACKYIASSYMVHAYSLVVCSQRPG